VTAAALLTELTRRGIELQARGDRVRFRRQDAVTPELLDQLKVHKPALLALLRQDPQAEPIQGGRNRPRVAPALPPSRAVRPDAPKPSGTCDAPRELSLAERVESGYVNPGWTPASWAERLRQLADRCEALRPELATQYRRWAVNVLKNQKDLA
jgi:hypothetical protein